MSNQKTILITVAEDIIIRNFFLTDMWPTFLKERQGDKIILVVQPDRVEYAQTKLATGNANIVVVPFKRCAPDKFENLVMSLARSGINTHTNLWSKMRSYKRGHSSWLDTHVKRSLAATLGNFDGYKRFIRKMILKTKVDHNAKEIFDTHKPDVLCATSLTNFDFDVVIAKTAQQLKIPIVGLIRSWDNLSSHGLMRILPDTFIVQNTFLEDMAYEHQAIAKGSMPLAVAGVPHYDVYKNPQPQIKPKEEFFKSLDLDVSKKLLMYGAMGEFLFINENVLPKIFNDLVEKGLFNAPVQFYYRAHPKFKLKEEDVKNLPNVIVSNQGKYVTEKGSADDEHMLLNLLYHSDVVVTAASTIAIDASVLNKPVVCVAFEGDRKLSRWESVKRFYDLYTHFEELLATKGVRVANTPEELVSHVNAYLANPSLDAEGRQRIIDRMVAPNDGKAGERWAKLISKDIDELTKK